MEITLKRLFQAYGSTFGYIELGDERLFTCERTWKNNIPFESCVPVGFYALEPYSSQKYPNTFALRGSTVSIGKTDLERYACVFHPANHGSQLEGCIAMGSVMVPSIKLKSSSLDICIGNSAVTTKKFISTIRNFSSTYNYLIIRSA